MKNVAWLKWIAGFDIEDLIGSILRYGIFASISLIIASLVVGGGGLDLGSNLKAKSLPLLILADFQQAGSPGFFSRLLLDLGVVILLLTPYVRLAASAVYFMGVERSLRHAMFNGLVLVVLTVILLTTLV